MLLSYFCCFKAATLLGASYWVHSVHEVMYYGSWCCIGMCLDSTGIRYIHISGDGIWSSGWFVGIQQLHTQLWESLLSK